jgi:predicted SprT family Zn-dependent metalloprotease
MSDYKSLVQKALDTYKPHANVIEQVAIKWLERNLKVEVSDRYRTRAGACVWRHCNETILTMKVVFGTKVLTPEVAYETVAHEVAHAVAIISEQDKEHDEIWQAICKKMGGTGKQYHTLPIVKNKVKRVCIVGEGKEHYVTMNTYATIKYNPKYTFVGIVGIDLNEKKFHWVQRSVANVSVSGPKLKNGFALIEA